MDLTYSLTRELKRWSDSEIDEGHIHEWAEELLEKIGWVQYDNDDPRSVPMEVLAQLDILNVQLIAQEDVPAFLRFLKLGQEEPLKAWAQWAEYWDQLDMTVRKSELSENQFYSC